MAKSVSAKDSAPRKGRHSRRSDRQTSERAQALREKIVGDLPEKAVKPGKVRMCWQCREDIVSLEDDPKKGLMWVCASCGFKAPASGGSNVAIKRARVEKVPLGSPEAKLAELDELFWMAKSYFKGIAGPGAGKSFPMAQQKWAEMGLKALTARIELEKTVIDDPEQEALMKLPAETRKKIQALLDEVQHLKQDGADA